jgi:hypothetical protein
MGGSTSKNADNVSFNAENKLPDGAKQGVNNIDSQTNSCSESFVVEYCNN